MPKVKADYKYIIYSQGHDCKLQSVPCTRDVEIDGNNVYREVVERRAHIVTGKKPTEAEIDNMIDTGESETIFKKAILEQGRGHVSLLNPCLHVFWLRLHDMFFCYLAALE